MFPFESPSSCIPSRSVFCFLKMDAFNRVATAASKVTASFQPRGHHWPSVTLRGSQLVTSCWIQCHAGRKVLSVTTTHPGMFLVSCVILPAGILQAGWLLINIALLSIYPRQVFQELLVPFPSKFYTISDSSCLFRDTGQRQQGDTGWAAHTFRPPGRSPSRNSCWV